METTMVDTGRHVNDALRDVLSPHLLKRYIHRMGHFTPVSAAIGGALFGVAAALLLLFNGRLMGISGIVGGALQRPKSTDGWRFAFLAGMLSAAIVMLVISPGVFEASPRSLVSLAIAGLLVGFGTRLGGGCTSGHGVCGLARLSGRSLAAVMIFMATAIGTGLVVKYVFGGQI
jgi:uncharacterized membrane protein YedE/YeeE